MIFKQYEVANGFGSNCYIIGCSQTKEAAVIDPGGDGSKLMSLIEESGIQVKYIINTHGHLDHIGANHILKEKHPHALIMIHEDDQDMLTDPKQNLSAFMGGTVTSPPADKTLKDGDQIKIGTTITLKVIHTPGHSKGGICLQGDNLVFTGDTLFGGSVGRSDFPGGSHQTLIKSIKEKLLILDDETIVYPGHGPETTIGEERETNPFIS